MSLHAVTAGSGADMVLLHGWGMSNAVWSGLLSELAQSYRLTLIELPGHGGSSYTVEGTLDAWVKACLETAPAQAHWIGWSLGGQIAQRAALIAPERISRLMLVCSSPCFIRAGDWPHAMLESTLHQFADALKRDHRQTLARFLSLQVQGDELARETLRLLRREIMQGSTPDPRALEHGLELLLTVDLRTQLHRLQCPSFWLLGEKDALVPGSVAQELALLAIPQAEFECLKGCAHAPFISHPARSLALVKQFFGTVDE